MKPNIWSFITPADPRTFALALAIAVAFFFGMRFEAVKTLKLKNEFTQYKLEQSELLAKAQQETLNEAVAAQAAIAEVIEDANARETQFAADNDRLRASFNAERMRRQALATELAKKGTSNTTTVCDAGTPEGELLLQNAEDLISLAKDADKVLSGFQDCQAYVKVIHQACE